MCACACGRVCVRARPAELAPWCSQLVFDWHVSPAADHWPNATSPPTPNDETGVDTDFSFERMQAAMRAAWPASCAVGVGSAASDAYCFLHACPVGDAVVTVGSR